MITLVTGLWNINRETLNEGWSRTFQYYLEQFDQLLKVENNLIIFGDKELEGFVWERRKQENTLFIIRDQEWFTQTVPYHSIQQIRNNPEWYNQVGWLKESTQAKLEMYNPLVMSKMFLLHDAKIFDTFNSEYLFWIDAGITNTVHPGYFTHDKVFDKLPNHINKFSFICFPYKTDSEIHGFNKDKINQLSGGDVERVARGGFFGGPKNSISNINSIYYDLLFTTINEGYMGTEESIFSIMSYKYSNIIDSFEIDGDGMLWKFFEDLKNNNLVVTNIVKNQVDEPSPFFSVGLYVITFNSPNQFKSLIESMLEYDSRYINSTTKFLLDNSTDETTAEQYIKLCGEYGFKYIKKDNLGICGGRQWIAEHFDKTKLDYYLFFEDDMFFYPKKGEVCKNGFNRFVDNLLLNSVEILRKEKLDFLKYNYTEFYGNNGTQWSWYNVPQLVREEIWPEHPKLPKIGTDENAPKTKFNNILSHNGVPYCTGEIYYSNWPQLVSREGNKKMFLDTTWEHPYEQTWMSHIYQETIKGNIRPGLLLITPTEHNRFDHYDGSLRKES